MNEHLSTLERELERLSPPRIPFDRLAQRRDRKRRDERIRAGVLGLAVAIALGWLGVSVIRSSSPAPGGEPPPETPIPTPMVWSPVQERGAVPVDNGLAWLDPRDAPVDWVDVRHVSTNSINDGTWILELAAKPPPVADREPGLLIAYGLVFETTGDGVADYVVGIDNNAPERGDFHVWVTDLATGETDEQIGPPHGFPIEFSHPDERGSGPSMVFTFLPGSAPEDFNPETVRFYAWAAASRGGEIFARDYAPDAGWLHTSHDGGPSQIRSREPPRVRSRAFVARRSDGMRRRCDR